MTRSTLWNPVYRVCYEIGLLACAVCAPRLYREVRVQRMWARVDVVRKARRS